jgi:hypothetical protein
LKTVLELLGWTSSLLRQEYSGAPQYGGVHSQQAFDDIDLDEKKEGTHE